MSGQIALVGGGEFRTGCEDMDRRIMAASGKDPAKVVVVPTATATTAATADTEEPVRRRRRPRGKGKAAPKA